MPGKVKWDEESPKVVWDDQPEEKSVSGFLGNVGQSGLRMIQDIASAVTSPVKTAKAVGGLAAGAVESVIPGEQGHEQNFDALLDFYKKRYGSFENLKKTLYEDPVGALADLSTFAGGAGLGAKAAQLPRVAKVAGAVARATDPVRAVTGPVGAVTSKLRKPEKMYESALKPSLAARNLPKVPEQVATGLREGIPVSPAGAEKISGLIEDLQNSISGKIGGSKASISPTKVAARADEVAQDFTSQVNPQADLQAIAGSRREFLERYAVKDAKGNVVAYRKIPAKEAQAMKVGTYRQIKKNYGQLSSATVEAQKALARGLKEELAAAIPELAELNARESKLLSLEPQIERALSRISNHQLFGIGTPIAAGGVAAVTGSGKLALAAGVMRAVLENPAVKSRLAIAINKVHARNPSKYGRPSVATSISRVQEYIDSLGQMPAEQE